jgi:hypothetical protein
MGRWYAIRAATGNIGGVFMRGIDKCRHAPIMCGTRQRHGERHSADGLQ